MVQTAPVPTAEPRAPEPATILVVEGNEEHQVLSVAALGRRGFRVSVADTGAEALRLLQRHPFQAVVLSSKLRDASGLEVLRSLVQVRSDVPVVFVVPEGSEEIAVRAMGSGASGHLVKTARYHELLPVEVEQQIAKARDRTRLAQQQKALGEAQTRFREFVESSREPIFVIDPTGAFVAANEAMAVATGFSREELLRLNLFDLLTPLTDPAPARRLVDSISGGPASPQEFSLTRRDSQVIYIHVTPHLVRKAGEVVGIEVLAKDITDRKRAENELKSLYSWLRAIHEATNEGILLADRDLRVVQWNARALELFGLDPGSMVDRTAEDLFRGLAARAADPQAALDAVETYRADPEATSEGILEITRPERRVYHRITSPVRNPDGALIGRLWTFRDITERQRAERVERAIYRISEAATAAKDLRALYRSIHEIVAELMPAKNFYIALHDPITETLDFPYFVDQKEPPPGRQPLGRGLTEYVLRSGRTILASPETFQALHEQGEIDLVGPDSLDWIGVPLVAGERPIGVLAIQTYEPGVRYGPRERDILSFVSSQVAMAVQRRLAEQSLRESEARFRRLTENAQDLIYRFRVTEPRGFEYVSPVATRMTGYTPEEHYADPQLGFKIVHPDDRPILEQAMVAGPPSGEPVTLRWIRRDGSVLWTEQRNVAIRDEAGRVVAIEGIARDITARMEVERAVHESEERYRLLAQATKDAIWDWDLETDTLIWSDAIYEILGYSADESPPTGAWWDSLIHPGHRERVLGRLWKCVHEGPDAWTAEYRMLRKDGTYAFIHDRGFILRGEDGRGSRMLGSLSDVTEAARTQEALRRRDATLAAVGFAADRFLRSPEWEAIVEEVLQRLGEATGADAVRLFESRRDADGRLFAVQRFRWSPREVDSPIDTAGEGSLLYLDGGFSRWADILSRGEIVHGHLKDFPSEERAFFQSVDLRTVTAVPILVGNQWWGQIGFDFYGEERDWSPPEREAIRAAAGTLAAAIERERAEATVRDSEERYRLLFERNPQPMWVFDLETLRFLAVNAAAIEHYGYSREDFLAMTIKDIRPAEDVPRLLENLAHPRDGLDHAGEWRHRRKDGSIIDVQITSHSIVFGGRSAELVLATDITERRRAERALDESRRTLVTLMSNLPGMAYRCLKERPWTMEFVSEGALALTGYPPSDLIRNRRVAFADVIHPEDRDRVWDEVQAALRERKPYQLQYRIRTAAGGEKWVWEQGRGIARPDGSVEALEGFVTDVTERLRTRFELERSERKFRALFEAAAEAIVLIDTKGKILDVNPAGEALARRARTDLVGHNLGEFFPPDELPRAREYLKGLLAGTPFQEPFETAILTPESGPRIVEVRSRVIRQAAAETYLEQVVRDVTEEREMQRRLLQSERLASIGQLAAYVAHEINTPLTNISLLAAGISRRVDDPEVQAKLEKLNVQRRQAAAIISDLLKFTTRRDVNAVETDLQEVLEATMEQVVPYHKPGVVVDLEPFPGSVLVRADPLQIQEVFVNLLKNALDATERGSVRVRVSDRGETVAVSIEDTGSGMTPEVRARLFEPFFTTKKLGEGTGLGLSLSQAIVAAHGGKIEVESEVGKGTKVTVLLPWREAHEDPRRR